MAILKGNESDDLTLKYLLQNNKGASQEDMDALKEIVGNATLTTTAQTLTDAVNELNGEILEANVAFTVTLPSASWTSNAQTVSNTNFIASGYAYIVSPVSSSFADYAAAVIYADDVSTTGQMTFHCSDVPTSNLTVNIVRITT